MKARVLSFLIAACSGFGFSPHLAANPLVFDQTSVEVELPTDNQEVKAVFPFRNTSQSAVTILEVITECDCIQSSVKPSIVESGQAGQVSLKFQSKLRNGTDVVRAKVVTDSNETHEISVSAKLRSYIEVSPLTLHWIKGERRDVKEFVVSSTGLAKLHFSRVAAVKASKVEIQRGEDPSVINVHVTPPAGSNPFQDILVVSAVVEGTNETKLYDLHVSAE